MKQLAMSSVSNKTPPTVIATTTVFSLLAAMLDSLQAPTAPLWPTGPPLQASTHIRRFARHNL